MSEKKVVQYRAKLGLFCVGHPAIVWPTNHYNSELVSNTKPVVTSKVVEVLDDGVFVTENTRYEPVK